MYDNTDRLMQMGEHGGPVVRASGPGASGRGVDPHILSVIKPDAALCSGSVGSVFILYGSSPKIDPLTQPIVS